MTAPATDALRGSTAGIPTATPQETDRRSVAADPQPAGGPALRRRVASGAQRATGTRSAAAGQRDGASTGGVRFPAPTACSEELITNNLGLARQAAWRFHRKTGQPYDDLEAIAFVGLIRGCRRYDPDRLNPGSGQPYALSTIVVPFINGEILHWFRDKGHAIKFPNKWRECWGKVQRLMSDPDLTAQDVAEKSGLTIAELTEMLGSMTGTANLDDIHGADGYDVPELELPRIDPLKDLVLNAWGNIHPADRGLLLKWWSNPRRLAYPSGPMEQFHRRVKARLQGRRLSEVLQLGLQITVPLVTPEPKAPKRKRSRKALEAAALQLGLIVA
jgi:hypothetical protein